MRLLLALLAACGTSASKDPHQLAECAANWFPTVAGKACELACASMPTSGGGCSPPCQLATTFDGIAGCCVMGPIPGVAGDGIVFMECQ